MLTFSKLVCTISPTNKSSLIKDRWNRTKRQSFLSHKTFPASRDLLRWTSWVRAVSGSLCSPFPPRDVSPHCRASAPAGAPSPGHLLAPSTDPATDIHTHIHIHTHTATDIHRHMHTQSSTPLDQPSPKQKWGNFFESNNSAKRPPHPPVNRFGETPASHWKIRKTALGRSPTERLRAPRELLQLSRRRRPPPPPSPKHGARPGRLLAPSLRGRASLHRPATPLQTSGPPSGHPAPTSAGALPLASDPDATTARRLPSPHPPRRRAPRPLLSASRTPHRPAVPGAPQAPLLGRVASLPGAPSPLAETPPLRPRGLSSAARGPHRLSGAAGGRTQAATGSRHQRSAPPGAASFSPGLVGTSAHGSPHRGYF